MSVTEAAPQQRTIWDPVPYRVTRRKADNDSVTTVTVAPAGDPLPDPEPGQFHMMWAFGVGEAPISVSRIGDGTHEHTIAAVGAVSAALAALDVGDTVGLRGPFGTTWTGDLDDDRDLLVVAGGIGLAPVRSVIDRNVSAARATTLVVGARYPDGLLYEDDRRAWAEAGIEVHTTVDHAWPGWTGEVGLVTAPLSRALVDPADTVAMVCGPEVMIQVTAERLVDLGVPAEAITVSLERNMQCGVGQCGRCQIGPVLLCQGGPVLPWSVASPLLEVPRW
jgi:anaerobic sulfite reductase subunit B